MLLFFEKNSTQPKHISDTIRGVQSTHQEVVVRLLGDLLHHHVFHSSLVLCVIDKLNVNRRLFLVEVTHDERVDVFWLVCCL